LSPRQLSRPRVPIGQNDSGARAHVAEVGFGLLKIGSCLRLTASQIGDHPRVQCEDGPVPRIIQERPQRRECLICIAGALTAPRQQQRLQQLHDTIGRDRPKAGEGLTPIARLRRSIAQQQLGDLAGWQPSREVHRLRPSSVQARDERLQQQILIVRTDRQCPEQIAGRHIEVAVAQREAPGKIIPRTEGR
jgi:hypothetical protein